MVFDAAGNVFLTDTDNNTNSRLLQLKKNGNVEKVWSVFTTVPHRRNGPEGLALAADGHVLVTDGGASRILDIDTSHSLVRTFAPGVHFEDLGHIAVDRLGNVYVAEAAPNLIYKFSRQGRMLARWHRPKGKGSNAWGGPQTIAAAPNGDLVVEDWPNRRILILSPAGRTVRAFGGDGRSEGQFVVTAGLGVDARGSIYVCDVALHQLSEFAPEGQFRRVINNTAQRRLFLRGPTAIAVDAGGTLYVADGDSVLLISANGTLLSRWR